MTQRLRIQLHTQLRKAFHCSSQSFGLGKSAIAPISRFRLIKGFTSARRDSLHICNICNSISNTSIPDPPKASSPRTRSPLPGFLCEETRSQAERWRRRTRVSDREMKPRISITKSKPYNQSSKDYSNGRAQKLLFTQHLHPPTPFRIHRLLTNSRRPPRYRLLQRTGRQRPRPRKLVTATPLPGL